MTSLSLPFWPQIATAEDTASPPRPRKRPKGPVLIGDSVIPCDHGTLLLALWRDWEEAEDDAPQP